MSTLNSAASDTQSRAIYLLSTESQDANTRRDDVKNRIKGSNFVKMDIVGVLVMNGCFGLGDSFKYGNCCFFGLFTYFALTDDFFNLCEVTVVVLLWSWQVRS